MYVCGSCFRDSDCILERPLPLPLFACCTRRRLFEGKGGTFADHHIILRQNTNSDFICSGRLHLLPLALTRGRRQRCVTGRWPEEWRDPDERTTTRRLICSASYFLLVLFLLHSLVGGHGAGSWVAWRRMRRWRGARRAGDKDEEEDED